MRFLNPFSKPQAKPAAHVAQPTPSEFTEIDSDSLIDVVWKKGPPKLELKGNKLDRFQVGVRNGCLTLKSKGMVMVTGGVTATVQSATLTRVTSHGMGKIDWGISFRL